MAERLSDTEFDQVQKCRAIRKAIHSLISNMIDTIVLETSLNGFRKDARIVTYLILIEELFAELKQLDGKIRSVVPFEGEYDIVTLANFYSVNIPKVQRIANEVDKEIAQKLERLLNGAIERPVAAGAVPKLDMLQQVYQQFQHPSAKMGAREEGNPLESLDKNESLFGKDA